MNLMMGGTELVMGSKYLTKLRSANDVMDNTDALRQRLEEDGYLFIRGFHDRWQVLEARHGMLRKLQLAGRLDPGYPMEEAVIHADNKSVFLGGAEKEADDHMQPFYKLVNSGRVLQFFERLLGGEAMTYDYKWPRAIAQGDHTGAHYDIVYMGRGTRNVYTMWTPLGDVPLDQGPLAVCLNSDKFEKVKRTYGQMDVDRDRVEKGWFSNDPLELVDKFGGQWATAPFEAGDAIIFGMFLMHASINNRTNRYRLSADTRYQLKSEPADERWIGQAPKGHYAWNKGAQVPMAEARKKWDV